MHLLTQITVLQIERHWLGVDRLLIIDYVTKGESRFLVKYETGEVQQFTRINETGDWIPGSVTRYNV